jgi:hypothetical protein
VGEDTKVNSLSLNGLVAMPVKGASPVTTFDAAQYTGSIAWKEGNAEHTGAFAAGTVYKAVLTLTVKPGYTFDGLAAGAFSHTGATSVTFDAASGTVTITFPETENVLVVSFNANG